MEKVICSQWALLWTQGNNRAWHLLTSVAFLRSLRSCAFARKEGSCPTRFDNTPSWGSHSLIHRRGMSLLEDEYKEEDYDQQKTETVKAQKAPPLNRLWMVRMFWNYWVTCCWFMLVQPGVVFFGFFVFFILWIKRHHHYFVCVISYFSCFRSCSPLSMLPFVDLILRQDSLYLIRGLFI